MAALEIRLDDAHTTRPLHTAGERKGSRPAYPARRSQSELRQLCDRSPPANRGLCRCAFVAEATRHIHQLGSVENPLRLGPIEIDFRCGHDNGGDAIADQIAERALSR